MKLQEEQQFAINLVDWYKNAGRDLPWRHTTNPYYIWVSEIMLQQTQVDTVKAYYKRFIKRFPTTKDLAAASEDEVFKLWEGLGYYRRAANLHTSAKIIEEQLDGKFPSTYEDILNLKGIGAYTASAVGSIAFGIPKGVVDGNILRIISRVYNRQDNIAKETTKKEYQVIMDRLIKDVNPSDFNQAMMDLGATVCTPRNAKCDLCPVSSYCQARKENTVALLPVNIKPRHKTDIELITGVIKYKDKFFIFKNKEGLLQNLYGLPQFEAESPNAFEDYFYDTFNLDVHLSAFVKTVKHVFTHRVWYMNIYAGQIATLPEGDFSQCLYEKDQLQSLAISTAHQKALAAYFSLEM